MIGLKQMAAFMALLFSLGIGGCLMLSAAPEDTVDTVAVSRIVRELGEHWGEGAAAWQAAAHVYDFAVLDMAGTLLYRSAPGISVSVAEAIKNRDATLPIQTQGGIVGTAIIAVSGTARDAAARKRVTLVLSACFLLSGALAGWYFVYLNRVIIRPFRKLEWFARQIAAGNLGVPLEMDRGNIFGAFTESFDLMRDQLADAREKERRANHSKKELVASLSHDIKTPITSIRLVSELLLVSEKDAGKAAKISTIYGKAGQIDQLVTDLFHSTLEELGEMRVNPTEEYSAVLRRIITEADYSGKATLGPIPDCLIRADLPRLEQVAGNLIYNSYKYADTPITVAFTLDGGCLRVLFQDHGGGVEEDELPMLLQKYYRGRNSGTRGKDGAGLGLYISKTLMDKMGGGLSCQNCPGGFAVELFLPLA